ncbi:MAG: DEAD/DEAH box helicase [Candidatus Micrarchaeota archaeon]|nr:DEAD/DEAH box helicase [Candidatus Micrarchaeota archaeon]
MSNNHPNRKRSTFISVTNSVSSQFHSSDDYNLLFRLSMPSPKTQKDNELETEKKLGSKKKSEIKNNNWKLEFFMQARTDPSLIYPLDQASASLNPILKNCTEKKLIEVSKVSGFTASGSDLRNGILELTTEDVYLFLKQDAYTLRKAGFAVQIPKNLEIKRNGVTKPGVSFILKNTLMTEGGGINSQKMLLYDPMISLGGLQMRPEEFAAIAKSKAHLVQVKDKWVEINPEDALRVMELIENVKDGKASSPADFIKFSLMAAGDGIETVFLSKNENGLSQFDSVLDVMQLDGNKNEASKFITLNEPEGFCGSLRPYQKRGLGWLDFLTQLGFGALLADDMGLGKTVQVIAHCIRQVAQGKRPILILCPTSVIGNWLDEFSRFAPKLQVLVHHGSERHDGVEFSREVAKADILITSYSLAWRDVEELGSLEWGMVVLDEAQNIKNPFTKQSQYIKKIRTKIRIALTGTPIENRLSELWSIMQFLNPGYLLSWEEFKEKFALPIENDFDDSRRKALRGAISPFLLRRLKSDKSIIADLPDKNEFTEWCLLTPEQATLYKAVVDSMLERIESEEGPKRKIAIFAAITKLKQVCNHPANFLKDSAELGERSGKVERLRELLDTMIENGESALVFSQYTEMAELLYKNMKKEFNLERERAHFSYLHGKLGRTQRDELVRKFQEDSDIPKIFFLSLKAGGTGLNLTKAVNVIHFDRWWNPAVENQATDRAYRIGQNKNVFVYKLTTKGTIEERIEDMLNRKKELADSIIGSGESILAKLDTGKLRELFELRDAD